MYNKMTGSTLDSRDFEEREEKASLLLQKMRGEFSCGGSLIYVELQDFTEDEGMALYF